MNEKTARHARRRASTRGRQAMSPDWMSRAAGRAADGRPRWGALAALAASLLGLGAAGCMDSPKNGDVFSGQTTGKQITFTGYFTEPNQPVKIQVLKTPDDPAHNDPGVAANWVTIGQTSSASSPTYSGVFDYYRWTVTATPAPSGSAQRWPAGGVLRVRALGTDQNGDFELATYDHDLVDCIAEHSQENEAQIAYHCESPFFGAAVVSSEAAPADQALDSLVPGFLTKKGVGSQAETLQYYKTIGVINQISPPQGALDTLAKFKSKFKFGLAGTDQADAAYYNAGDLGVGREMHCKSFQLAGMSSPGRACYVSNYFGVDGGFGGDVPSALSSTVAGFQSGNQQGAAATVAMLYFPPAANPNSVQFIVYDGNGNLKLRQPLDSHEFNDSIPQNCIVCHGGGAYGSASHTVAGARFLPFDLDSFEYSSTPGFTRNDQEEELRELNAHVRATDPAPATAELIDGWYSPSAVTIPGATFDGDFIPPDFQSPPGFSTTQAGQARKVYRHVVAPYCRTCHVAQVNFPFNDGATFLALASILDQRVCSNDNPASGQPYSPNHQMPQAEQTARSFWKSPARAYLAQYLGLRGSCKPTP